ncbi:MAG TPA: alpha/beta hydrolase [Caulobacter sp.]|nr:alpha/beta hydrolase [Caulobacter sp.]
MAAFMISLRAKADDSKIGPARYLRIGDDGAQTALSPTAWRKAVLDSFTEKTPQGLPRGDLLFYVHGFNTSFKDALKGDADNRAKLAAHGWTGVYVSYDWPSLGETLGYYADRSNARASANALIDSALTMFVGAIVPDCQVRVSIMAHSMGAFVVRQAFSWAYQDVKTNAKAWSISQLLLVAGDVSQGSLSADQDGGRWFNKYVGRTTLYSNRFDSVLKISDLKNGEPTPRAGRVGLPADAPASFCDIDCSALFNGLDLSLAERVNPATAHCFYFKQDGFWRDAVLTLEGGIDRHVIPTRALLGTTDNRFTLKTKPITVTEYQAALQLAQAGN